MAEDIKIVGDTISISGTSLENLEKLARRWGLTPHEALARAVREAAAERRETGSAA